MLNRVATLLFACAFAIVQARAQDKPFAKATKPFAPPSEFYVDGAPIAKDEGCAKDYARALSLSGLDQRKMLADLVTYHCVEVLEGRWKALIVEGKNFGPDKQPVHLVRVNLAFGLHVLPVGRFVEKRGWILPSNLIAIRPSSPRKVDSHE